jgi:hypothetical protein
MIWRRAAVNAEKVAAKGEARRQRALAVATARWSPGLVSRLRLLRGMIAAVMIFRPAACLVRVQTERQTRRRRMERDQQRKQKPRDGPLCGSRLPIRSVRRG